MNFGFLRFLLGRLILVMGALFLLPFIVAVIYREDFGLVFFIMAVVCMLCGYLISRRKPAAREFYAREGFVATSLSWILMSLIGALPFVLSGTIDSYVDALFETVSGFTTTGGSILTSSGAASPTGSEVWACWCSCSRSCPWQTATACT